MCKSLIPIPGAAVLAFIAIIVFLVLLIIVMRPKGDSLKKWLVAYAVIIVAYIGYVCYTCGPNPKDVAIMKSMAKKISEYIVQNGIPKSLKDISGLPYELECSQENGNSCYFVIDSKYTIEYRILASGTRILGTFSAKSKTGYQVDFKIDKKNNKLYIKDSGAYSMKNTGICSTMKQ